MSTVPSAVQAGSTAYSIAGATRIDLSMVRAVKMSEAPEEDFQRVIAAQEMYLKNRYTEPADISKNPSYQDYARVMVNEQEVARLDNNGFLITSNSVSLQLDGKIPGLGPTGRSGPLLAQARAEAVAKLFKGEVVMSDTAMTQERYDATPKPTAIFDQAAMTQDPMYRQIQETRKARLLFLAQQMA